MAMTVGYFPTPHDVLTHTTTPPAPTRGYPEDPKSSLQGSDHEIDNNCSLNRS